MKSTLLASGALFGALAFSTAAVAQDAYVTADLNMRAGPGTRYPVVTTIPESRGIDVYGCTQSANWCDVGWRGNRGWVYSDYIEYIYQGRRVMLPEYRSRIDLPVIGFSFGSYWDQHYRGRPWYADRDRWSDGRRGDWDGRRDDDRGRRDRDGRDYDRGDWDRGDRDDNDWWDDRRRADNEGVRADGDWDDDRRGDRDRRGRGDDDRRGRDSDCPPWADCDRN